MHTFFQLKKGLFPKKAKSGIDSLILQQLKSIQITMYKNNEFKINLHGVLFTVLLFRGIKRTRAAASVSKTNLPRTIVGTQVIPIISITTSPEQGSQVP